MNIDFLKKAIELSKESLEQGKFPAGAVIVKGNKIVGTETSSAYPHQHLHAETKLIDKTMAEVNDQLGEYKLYTSLAPCLMCLGKIYWQEALMQARNTKGSSSVYPLESFIISIKYLFEQLDTDEIDEKILRTC